MNVNSFSGAEELALVDAGWDSISNDETERGDAPPVSGVFGHVSERRIGMRVKSQCWALLSDGMHSAYARAVELSSTGAVLRVLDRWDPRAPEADHRLTLDLFVPGSQPVHAAVRHVRDMGRLAAFEFTVISRVDRLTLAEHLDHAAHPSAPDLPGIVLAKVLTNGLVRRNPDAARKSLRAIG